MATEKDPNQSLMPNMSGGASYPPEVLAYIKSAREKSAELHSDIMAGETPSAMMARLNTPLTNAANKVKPVRRKRPMVKQAVVPTMAPLPVPVDEMQEIPANHQPQLPGQFLKQEFHNNEQPEPQHTAVPPQEFSATDGLPARNPDMAEVASTPEPNIREIPEQPKVFARQEEPVNPARVEMVRQSDGSHPYDRGAPRREYDAASMIAGIPSQGIGYSNPLYGQALTLIDILLLEGANDFDRVDVYDEILGRRVRGVDPGYILWGDEAYIFQWLRISSFPAIGIPYPKGFRCPECGYVESSPDYQITMKQMEFRPNHDPHEIMAGLTDKDAGYFEFAFSDTRRCHVYLRRRYHDRIVQAWRNKYIEDHRAIPKDAYVRLAAIAAILEIEDCPTHEDKLRYLCSLANRDDYTLLTEMINAHSLIVENHVMHTCPRCGTKVDTIYPFRTEEYISNL